MRRSSAITIVLCLLPVLLHAANVTFTDIGSSPYKASIKELAQRNIVQGYDDSTFRPNTAINRAEYIKILMESRFGLTAAPSDLRCFTDLEVKTPQWYATHVCKAAMLGIVGGYPDGTFRPVSQVNLAEALKMEFLSFGITPTATGGAWYEPYLNEARNHGILLPLLKNPAHILTRGEMAELTYALVAEDEDEQNNPDARNAICGNGVQEKSEQCDDGNTKDSDGCSSICILVPEPVRRAILQIDQRASGTITNVTQGQQQVTMLKFTATAARQDALLTVVTFKASVGSLVYGKHYTLSMDRTGDGVYETIAQSDGKVDSGYLVFDQMANGGILIPNGIAVPFRVTADLPSSMGPATIALSFATDLPDYIEAQGETDGIGLTGIETNNVCSASDCFIRVNTESSTDVNVAERGSVYVSADTVPVRNHILLASSVTDTLLRLRVRADNEPIDLTSIAIDGVPSSVDSLLLFSANPGGSFNTQSVEPFAEATHGQCTSGPSTRFCAVLGISTFVINPSQERGIAVAARISSDALGGVSGQPVLLTISAATDTQNAAVTARGISSKQDLAQNNGDANATGEIFIGQVSPAANTQISGKTNDIAFASIGNILREGVSTQSFIPPGQSTIGSFRISALTHGNSFHGSNDVILKTLVFHITAQNVLVDPSSFRLSRSEDPAVEMLCSGGGSTGSFDVTCSGMENSPVENHIGQGLAAVFNLKGNVTNQKVNPGQSTLLAELFPLGDRSQTNAITWSDEETTFTWVDVPFTAVSGTLFRSN